MKNIVCTVCGKEVSVPNNTKKTGYVCKECKEHKEEPVEIIEEAEVVVEPAVRTFVYVGRFMQAVIDGKSRLKYMPFESEFTPAIEFYMNKGDVEEVI